METKYDEAPQINPVQCHFYQSTTAGSEDFHFHECYEIYLLLEGEISYYVEQSRCCLKPGDLILFTDQEIHKAVNRSGAVYSRAVLWFDPMYAWQFCSSQTNLLRCFHQHRPGINNVISLTPEQVEHFLKLFKTIESWYGGLPGDYTLEEELLALEYGRDLKGIMAFTQLLLMINEAFICRADQSPDPYSYRLQPMLQYIETHLSTPITLEDLAHACSLDKYYLSHLFKKETGSSIFQYILVKRVAAARELLCLGSSVAKAGEEAGFHDYANFIRTFKKITGRSPGTIKKLSQDPIRR